MSFTFLGATNIDVMSTWSLNLFCYLKKPGTNNFYEVWMERSKKQIRNEKKELFF